MRKTEKIADAYCWWRVGNSLRYYGGQSVSYRLSTRAVSSYVFRFFNECALYPRSSANIFQGTKLTADSCTQIFIIILFIIPEYVRQFKCPLLWNQVK